MSDRRRVRRDSNLHDPRHERATGKENNAVVGYKIQGDKIAQLVPVLQDTMFAVEEADVLRPSSRGANGFGSSGR
jgi:dUTPase